MDKTKRGKGQEDYDRKKKSRKIRKEIGKKTMT